jgi:Tol biopolymer transport system component
MREVRHALKWAGQHTPVPRAAETSRPNWLPWSVAAFACAAALVSVGLWLKRPTVEAAPMQFHVDAPPGGSFNYMITAGAVSPDGRYLVFRAATGASPPSLWLRPLDSTAARPLPGTENADFPFWSPESTSIAFFAEDKLKKIDITGGAPAVLCDATGGVMSDALGGTWSRAGVIVFGDRRGLFRVSASGGSPESLIAGDAARLDGAFGLPQFLPDGRRFLYFMASSDPNAEGVYAASLDAPSRGVLVLKSPAKALYVAPLSGRGPGHLLFVRQRSLMAQRFDAGSLRLEGDPTPVADDVAVLSSLHAAAFWASDSGLLAYRGGVALENSTLAWVTRDGRRTGEAAREDAYTALRLAANGKRVVLGRRDPGASGDIWVYDLERGIKSRLTFDRHVDTSPAWSPDGLRVAFTSDRTGLHQLYMKSADAAQPEVQLTQTPTSKDLLDWSSDGRFLLYRETGAKSFDLMALALEQKTAMPVSQSPFDEIDGQFSPDGKWVAYTSNESGRHEVYVMPFAPAGGAREGKWQISSQGGRGPRWRGDNQELYFVSADNRRIMAASVSVAGERLETGAPVELFATSVPPDIGDNLFPYDVTRDGQRFLVEERVERKSAPLTVLVNWQSKLKAR